MPCAAAANQPQRVQGLLTYAIVDILSRASRPITYGELAYLVRQRYPQWGRTTGPTPVVEGLAQDRVVLGVQRWADRSRQRWQKIDSHLLSVNEGSVEGLTPGSIVALHPPIDQPNAAAVLGYAELTDCNLLDSDAKLVKYNGVRIPRMDALPVGGMFEMARTDYGSLRLKLGVDPQPLHTISSVLPSPLAGEGPGAREDGAADAVADSAAKASLQALAAQLKAALAQHGSLCEFVDDPNSAGWVVQMRDGKLNLLSKDAAQIRGKTPPETPRFTVAASGSGDDTAADIVRQMTQIARAQNLLKLSDVEQSQADTGARRGLGDDPSRLNVQLKLLRYKGRSDPTGEEVHLDKGPLTLHPGDYVGWRMTNLGRSDVAVSLLYIDAGFGIHALFPRPGSGTDNMLTKGGGTFSTKSYKITADPSGTEHVVLIAVPRRAEQQSPDFSFLEQPALEKVLDRGDNSAMNSPLGRLLLNAMYGEGGSRGMDTAETVESRLMLQTWRVSAE